MLNGVVDDAALAITYAAAMQGRSLSGESLRGRWLLPSLFLQEFYKGLQDDGCLFLMDCLSGCEGVLRHFEGRYWAKEFECGSCWRRSPAGSHEVERNFTSVEISTKCGRRNVLHEDVQDAVDSLFAPSLLDADFQWMCPHCGGERPPCEVRSLQRSPEILLIQVKQWE